MELLPVVLGFAFVVMSIILHEYAHGYVAYLCGDDTAYRQGRLTLNPIAHIDPFLTILLPLMLFVSSHYRFMFGGAKPVPINPFKFRNRMRDYRLVSVAGIAVNCIIAAFCAVFIHLLKLSPKDPAGTMIGMVCYINLLLAVFNLFPIPPLDGSRILRTFLPAQLRDAFDRLDRFGMIILIIFLYFGVFRLLHPVLDFIMIKVFFLKEFVSAS